MNMDKYKPIGKHWRKVDTLGGKPVFQVRADSKNSADDLHELFGIIADAEKEYGTKAKIERQSVLHGSSNRDGQSNQRYVDHYTLMIEVPTYSSADTLDAIREHFKDKYGVSV